MAQFLGAAYRAVVAYHSWRIFHCFRPITTYEEFGPLLSELTNAHHAVRAPLLAFALLSRAGPWPKSQGTGWQRCSLKQPPELLADQNVRSEIPIEASVSCVKIIQPLSAIREVVRRVRCCKSSHAPGPKTTRTPNCSLWY